MVHVFENNPNIFLIGSVCLEIFLKCKISPELKCKKCNDFDTWTRRNNKDEAKSTFVLINYLLGWIRMFPIIILRRIEEKIVKPEFDRSIYQLFQQAFPLAIIQSLPDWRHNLWHAWSAIHLKCCSILLYLLMWLRPPPRRCQHCWLLGAICYTSSHFHGYHGSTLANIQLVILPK